MKKIISASLITLAAATGFLLNNQPVEAHGRYGYYDYDYGYGYGGFPNYRYPYRIQPRRLCYPTTQLHVDKDPAYHPHAYSDGYRQGRSSAKNANTYKPRTAGGEFARGFDDGYYGREFAGQKNVVANVIEPYTTTECDWY